mmetsp:Transcript_19506/g.32088  ORF Transcript_19506/g.32088 Transcript_19506/m.32088 type:complete len:104 (+) Transcript_19506:117-428(+)|eukprot:CAMPEP_0203767314 /NCGR_PEP_ID=MMETSP0099_2-20121227/927_1 /ASSEMBLY_ACC=CAM_ASM_000209 /TAXON_ID=96639 /ORGANISM=" , Strain NY0313808BC1" /LENGTH=103 /DNA_ID=CAMNT_0050663807 /DNA_START=315 /DNA_END=626 /DNA_ORIENTATION=+
MPHEEPGRIEYSEKYFDDKFEYRHVILPKAVAKEIPKDKLLEESEWRTIGVQQSRGWVHYAIHRPEPHILLFRRPLGTDPATGHVDPVLQRVAKERYEKDFMA